MDGYKFINSTKLDNALEATADAIRTKTGDSADITFDFANETGFASAVEAIPSGGYVAADWFDMNIPTGLIITSEILGQYDHQFCMFKRKGNFSVHFTETKTLSENIFQSSNVRKIVAPKCTAIRANACASASYLTHLDTQGIGGYSSTLNGASALTTIILRGTTLTGIASNTFTGTPFKSGGSGGTIYIPKALYDHLGDGTELDYKAATNWSTIDGYGTVT